MEQTIEQARSEAIDRVIDEIGGPDALESFLEVQYLRAQGLRFLLVQRNYRGARQHWLSGHENRGRAASYILGEEYAEDWETIGLYDLDTGWRYDAKVSITWEKS